MSHEKIRFILVIIFLLIAFPGKSHAQFASYNLGMWNGTAHYSETGKRGTYPIKYFGLNMLGVAPGDFYMKSNLNYLLNGSRAVQTGDGGVKGVDISLFSFSYGTAYNNSIMYGIHFDYGWYGPQIPSSEGSYNDLDNGMYFAIGVEGALYIPYKNLVRTTTFLTVNPIILTRSDKKVNDGFSIAVESQIQLSVLHYIGVGITPKLEFRNYTGTKWGENVQIHTFAFSTQLHVFVGF